jgi:hypothetical protein
VLLCTGLTLLCAQAAEPRADEVRPARSDYRGIFSFRSENDFWAGNDNNYTNGIAASWTTSPIEDCKRPEPGFWCKVVNGFDWLPKIGDEDWEDYVGFEAGQEMYTPEDITLPEPPPGDQPYAGVLYWDTSVYAKSARSLHSYTWRLGVVGPASGAEETQKFIHRLIGAKEPQGWDTQLSNELLLNFGYQFHRRILRDARERGFGYDVALNGGGDLGNYYIGANGGVQLRFGHALPDNFGTFDIRRGSEALVGMGPSPTGWHAYAHLQAQAVAIGRFLPSDGNTFKDSREGDRDDFYSVISAGGVFGWKRLFFSYMYNLVVGDSFVPTKRDDDYGAIALHYLF